MDNLKNKNFINHNATETELLKPSEIIPSYSDDFNFPQEKDLNILSEYYNKKKGNNHFMEKINKLNKKFYNCSENYNKTKKKLEKLNDDLFMNLFKQINSYVEEIERLNKKIAGNNNQELKKTIDNLNKEINEKKEKTRNYEVKLKEKTENEEKLMKEIEFYKRRIIFYKDKIKIGLLSRTRNADVKGKNNIYFMSTNKKNVQNINYIFTDSEKQVQSILDKNNNNKEKLSIQLTKKLNNKDDIISEKEEQDKNKSKKIAKFRESVIKTEDNLNQKSGKHFSDLYDADNDINDIKLNNEDIHLYKLGSANLNLDLKPHNFSSKLKSSYGLIFKEIDEKNRTFDGNNNKINSDDSELKKKSDNCVVSDTKYTKSEIKSKILNVQKVDKKGNKVIKIDDLYKNKSKQRRQDKMMNQKAANTTSYIISKFSGQNTPYINNKYSKQYIKDKMRLNSIKSKKCKNIQINNNRINDDQNQNSSNKLKEIKLNDLNKGNHELLRNKNIDKKTNKKDFEIILKIVNDDYSNSIEMLKTQEEQIKTMLQLMNLNEE